MAGVLVMSAQYRMFGGNRVVWLCDQKAVETFLAGNPPVNPRLLRWCTFWGQMKLKVFHLAGVKNELLDFTSRRNFEARVGVDVEELAQDAMARMDIQIDLSMEEIGLCAQWRTQDYEED